MKRIGAALLSLQVLLSSLPVLAQTANDAAGSNVPEVEQARQRFQRGAELYKEGSFDAALAEFTRAYQLVPNYRVLYNIAQVQLERHDYAAALQAFQDYLKQGGTDVSSDRREQVEREINNLKGRVAELTVTSNVEGAELSVDGVTVGKVPLKSPVLVSSGVRRLALKKEGYPPSERTISVVGGDKPQIEIRLETTRAEPLSPAVASASEPVPPAEHRAVKPGVWIGVAAAGVFTGAAVTFGVLAHRADTDLDKELGKYPADRSKIEDNRSRLKLYAGLTDGFAGAAAVSALLAVYFAISGSRSSESAEARPPALRAHVVPTGNGVAVHGAF